MSKDEANFNATLELLKSVTKSPKDEIIRTFNQTIRNCYFYEEEGRAIDLLNEIGVLRGLAYSLEAFGECPHDDAFVHFIEVQNQLKSNNKEKAPQ